MSLKLCLQGLQADIDVQLEDSSLNSRFHDAAVSASDCVEHVVLGRQNDLQCAADGNTGRGL
jgi:hypothetical protein